MIKDFNFKIFWLLILGIVIGITVILCFKQPQIHKPLQINVIEYILKINTDGSVTTTKSVKTNIVKERE